MGNTAALYVCHTHTKSSLLNNHKTARTKTSHSSFLLEIKNSVRLWVTYCIYFFKMFALLGMNMYQMHLFCHHFTNHRLNIGDETQALCQLPSECPRGAAAVQPQLTHFSEALWAFIILCRFSRFLRLFSSYCKADKEINRSAVITKQVCQI